MSTLLWIVITAVVGLLGVAVGWYLRPRVIWCRTCGTRLICQHCARRAGPEAAA